MPFKKHLYVTSERRHTWNISLGLISTYACSLSNVCSAFFSKDRALLTCRLKCVYGSNKAETPLKQRFSKSSTVDPLGSIALRHRGHPTYCRMFNCSSASPAKCQFHVLSSGHPKKSSDSCPMSPRSQKRAAENHCHKGNRSCTWCQVLEGSGLHIGGQQIWLRAFWSVKAEHGPLSQNTLSIFRSSFSYLIMEGI